MALIRKACCARARCEQGVSTCAAALEPWLAAPVVGIQDHAVARLSLKHAPDSLPVSCHSTAGAALWGKVARAVFTGVEPV